MQNQDKKRETAKKIMAPPGQERPSPIRVSLFLICFTFLSLVLSIFLLSGELKMLVSTDSPSVSGEFLSESNTSSQRKTSFLSFVSNSIVRIVDFISYGAAKYSPLKKIRQKDLECFALVKEPNRAGLSLGESSAPQESPAELYPINKSLEILDPRKMPPSLRKKCQGLPIVQGYFDIKSARFDDTVLSSIVHNLEQTKLHYPQLYERISELHIHLDMNTTVFLLQPKMQVYLSWDWDIQEIRRLYASVAYIEKERVASRYGHLDLRTVDGLYWGE